MIGPGLVGERNDPSQPLKNRGAETWKNAYPVGLTTKEENTDQFLMQDYASSGRRLLRCCNSCTARR